MKYADLTCETLSNGVTLTLTRVRGGVNVAVQCTHTLERYDALTDAEADFVCARLTRKYSGVDDIHTLLQLAED